MPRRYRSLLDLAARIRRRAGAGQVVHLSPETAIVVAAALRAFSTAPGRDAIAMTLCSARTKCPRPCDKCIGKANAVERLYCPDAVDHQLDHT